MRVPVRSVLTRLPTVRIPLAFLLASSLSWLGAAPAGVGPPESVDVLVRTEAGATVDAALPERANKRARDATGTVLETLGYEVIEVRPGDLDAVLEDLRAEEGVLSAEPDRPVRADADAHLPEQWGLHRLGFPQAWDEVAADATVAVLDTGVDRQAAEIDPGRWLEGENFTAAGEGDGNGHGTKTASVLAAERGTPRGLVGACHECTILSVKVLDDDGFGSMSDVAAGIAWAADQNVDVINLSLGGEEGTSALADAVDYAESNGVVVVASAGNQGSQVPKYPASYPTVLAIAGSDDDDQRFTWSNHGAATDLAAPGCNLAYDLDQAVGWYCGTSSAAPIASASVALTLAADPSASPADVREYLARTAVDVGSWAGAGRIDTYAAVRAAAGDAEPVEPSIEVDSHTRRLQEGERLDVTGAVRPAEGGHTVRLERNLGGRWSTLATTDTRSDGTFRAVARPGIPGESSLRVRVPHHGLVSSASDLVVTVAARRPGGQPVPGDYNGDGRTTPGWFEDGRWTIRIDAGTVRTFSYGRAGDAPLVGDWNGDGSDTIGIIRDREWHLRDRLRGGAADRVFTYGRITRGDIPLVGDWNGDGSDTIGIVRDGEWHLRDRLRGGAADRVFTYGRVTRGDIPAVGDWNGSGQDGPGIVREEDWHLRYRLRGGAADLVESLP